MKKFNYLFIIALVCVLVHLAVFSVCNYVFNINYSLIACIINMCISTIFIVADEVKHYN